MKLCPKCNLNWIEDDEDCCLVCRRNVTIRGGVGGRKPINEYFIIINQRAFYRQRNGFQAYNSKGENVGIICMCFDKRTPAFECCELCFYEKYHNRYGEWNRIQSNGGRIKWSRLCELLENKDKIKIFVD